MKVTCSSGVSIAKQVIKAAERFPELHLSAEDNFLKACNLAGARRNNSVRAFALMDEALPVEPYENI